MIINVNLSLLTWLTIYIYDGPHIRAFGNKPL